MCPNRFLALHYSMKLAHHCWMQLHWFKVAMVNNSKHAMRALDLNVHPMTKVWRNFAQSGLLRGMFPEFFKLAEIAMIQVC